VVDGSNCSSYDAEECDQSSNSSEQDIGGVEKLPFSTLARSPVRWPQVKRTVSPMVAPGTRKPAINNVSKRLWKGALQRYKLERDSRESHSSSATEKATSSEVGTAPGERRAEKSTISGRADPSKHEGKGETDKQRVPLGRDSRA